jgi:hypothetical protein
VDAGPDLAAGDVVMLHGRFGGRACSGRDPDGLCVIVTCTLEAVQVPGPSSLMFDMHPRAPGPLTWEHWEGADEGEDEGLGFGHCLVVRRSWVEGQRKKFVRRGADIAVASHQQRG